MAGRSLLYGLLIRDKVRRQYPQLKVQLSDDSSLPAEPSIKVAFHDASEWAASTARMTLQDLKAEIERRVRKILIHE